MPRAIATLFFALAFILGACGGDDGPAIDAASGSDGASGMTLCPPTDDLNCTASTEVCVVTGPFGPTNMSSCEAVPAGCEKDRTCSCVAASLCNATDTCSEPADNTIFCDNGSQ